MHASRESVPSSSPSLRPTCHWLQNLPATHSLLRIALALSCEAGADWLCPVVRVPLLVHRFAAPTVRFGRVKSAWCRLSMSSQYQNVISRESRRWDAPPRAIVRLRRRPSSSRQASPHWAPPGSPPPTCPWSPPGTRPRSRCPRARWRRRSRTWCSRAPPWIGARTRRWRGTPCSSCWRWRWTWLGCGCRRGTPRPCRTRGWGRSPPRTSPWTRSWWARGWCRRASLNLGLPRSLVGSLRIASLGPGITENVTCWAKRATNGS